MPYYQMVPRCLITFIQFKPALLPSKGKLMMPLAACQASRAYGLLNQVQTLSHVRYSHRTATAQLEQAPALPVHNVTVNVSSNNPAYGPKAGRAPSSTAVDRKNVWFLFAPMPTSSTSYYRYCFCERGKTKRLMRTCLRNSCPPPPKSRSEVVRTRTKASSATPNGA